MEHWSRLLSAASPSVRADRPGSGAAGGVGFAGRRSERIWPTARPLPQPCRCRRGHRPCRPVVTGEGRLDEQTLLGKAPAAIAARSHQQGISCVAVVGSRAETITDEILAEHGFIATYELVGHSPHAWPQVLKRLARRSTTSAPVLRLNIFQKETTIR